MLSATVAIALTACGGGGGSTSANENSGNSGGSNNGGETSSSYYGAFVPLSLDAEGKISGDYFCSEETQKDTMYRINTFYSLEECNATLNSWVAEFNKDEAPATAEQREGLAYINDIRRGTGLPIFHGNSALERAAKNHELYIGDVEEQYGAKKGHLEDNVNYPSEYYTGVEPADRAWYEGYNGSWKTSEVLTRGYGVQTAKESLMSLMTTIYHRQGLLWNHSHEVGMGATPNEFSYRAKVHMLGVKSANEDYLRAVSATLVAYPYDGQKEVQRAFYNNEIPDPLPNNSAYVGNPISVSFNSSKAGEITMVSFKLFYDETDVEVTNVQLMDELSDPNRRFTAHDFALFPMDILDGETTYRVEFDYVENGEDKSKVWRFTTRP